MYLDLLFPRFMDYARGVVMAWPLILHAGSWYIVCRHSTDVLPLLSSGGAATHSDYSQSVSANMVMLYDELGVVVNVITESHNNVR
jgi:hypothetical protein